MDIDPTLSTKSIEDLEQLLLKQEKILISPVSKNLPDKGEKLRKRVEEIRLAIIEKKKQQESTIGKDLQALQSKLRQFVVSEQPNENSQQEKNNSDNSIQLNLENAPVFFQTDEDVDKWDRSRQVGNQMDIDTEMETLQHRMEVVSLKEEEEQRRRDAQREKSKKIILGTNHAAPTTRSIKLISPSEVIELSKQEQNPFEVMKESEVETTVEEEENIL